MKFFALSGNRARLALSLLLLILLLVGQPDPTSSEAQSYQHLTDQHLTDSATLFDLTISLKQPDVAALDRFIEQLHNPASASYHKWLTPDEFGAHFGVSESDYQRVADWLAREGFQAITRWPSRLQLNFRGSAATITRVFHTNISHYQLAGDYYFTNDRSPQLPVEIADLIRDIHGLENLSRPHPSSIANFTDNGITGLAPGDLRQLYNLTETIENGINGNGEKVGIVARSNFLKRDVRLFRARFGLPVNDPKKVFPFGMVNNLGKKEELEVLLNTEWAGAVAPMAEVVVSIAPDLESSLQYLVNRRPDIHSICLSFGQCEARLGSRKINFYHDLYSQAVAQGQTVFVAAGDDGADGCGNQSQPQINGLAASPNCVAVGGSTALVEYDNNGNAVKMRFERAWKFGGGGDSTIFGKPSYQQQTPGTSMDDHRAIPDIAQVGDPAIPGAWISRRNRLECCLGGTSLSTPIWASFYALIAREVGPQGNLNFSLYRLGNDQQAGAIPAVFNDIIAGDNNSVGVPGFAARPGYDRVTGWGSFNGAGFLNQLRSEALARSKDH